MEGGGGKSDLQKNCCLLLLLLALVVSLEKKRGGRTHNGKLGEAADLSYLIGSPSLLYGTITYTQYVFF